MPGHAAVDQLKEEDCAHQKYSVVIISIALPVEKGAAEGRRHHAKGFLPKAGRKALTEVSRISWENRAS